MVSGCLRKAAAVGHHRRSARLLTGRRERLRPVDRSAGEARRARSQPLLDAARLCLAARLSCRRSRGPTHQPAKRFLAPFSDSLGFRRINGRTDATRMSIRRGHELAQGIGQARRWTGGISSRSICLEAPIRQR